MKNMIFLHTTALYFFTIMTSHAVAPVNCGPDNNNCSPDHPAQLKYECALDFSGFIGQINQFPKPVADLETCILEAATQVQLCFDKSSAPELQAFHDDIYTALIFSKSGERMYWDFYYTDRTHYDNEGNTVVTYTIDKANLSDLRPTN